MKQPVVTVFMAAYNGERYIRQALEIRGNTGTLPNGIRISVTCYATTTYVTGYQNEMRQR